MSERKKMINEEDGEIEFVTSHGCTVTIHRGTKKLDDGERIPSFRWQDVTMNEDADLYFCDKHDVESMSDKIKEILENISEGKHKVACQPQDGLCRCAQEFAEEAVTLLP